jgi:flagellar biosynthesis protein FlhA
VLQNLLAESVPVKDMRNIIDTLTAHAKENQDASHLTSLVRPKLGRLICQPLVDDTGTLTVITLAPDLEKLLESSRAGAETEHVTLDPTLANSMIESLKTEAEKIQDTGAAATLVVSPGLRSWMSRFVRVRVPDLTVLSYTEIPDDQRIQVQSSIGGETAIEGETE